MIIKVVVFFCLSVIVQTGAKDDASKVIEVTTDTIDAFFSSSNSSSYIIEFYATWCNHCKQFEVPFEKLAMRLTNENFK